MLSKYWYNQLCVFLKERRMFLWKKNKHEETKADIIKDRIFGFFAAILNLTFAFGGGLWIKNHFIAMFLPNHAMSVEAFTIVCGLLLVLMGIAGTCWSLHYFFYKTKLEKYFPGFFGDLG